MNKLTSSLSLTTVTALISLVAAAGCNGAASGSDDLDTTAAAVTVDSAQTGTSEGSMLAASVDGVETATPASGSTVTAVDVALFIKSHIGARMLPAGCATAETSGATTTITYANCTGPRGLVAVDGTIVLTASLQTGGAISFTATATDFTIGELMFDINDTAVYTSNSSGKSLAVTTSGTATGPLGGTLTHDGSYTATYTGTCATIDGAWSSETTDKSRSTTVDLTRCAGSCPTGNVTRDTFDGRVITVTFDGSAKASWTSSTGRSGSFTLDCN